MLYRTYTLTSGHIVERTGPVSYEVDVGSGLWSRHCDQVLSAAAESPDEGSSRAAGEAPE